MGKFYKNCISAAFLVFISFTTYAFAPATGYKNPNPFGLVKQEVSVSVYPNPAVAKTTIAYQLTSRASVYMRVVDLSGKQLAVLLQKQVQNSGKYEFVLEFEKYRIQSGMYIIHILIDNQPFSKKIIVQ